MALLTDRGLTTDEKIAAPLSTGPVASAGLRVCSYIGKGNFAFVYKGVHDNRQVAIKAVPYSSHSEQGLFAIQSLIHEAKLLRKCSHPNVLKVYGTAVLEGNALYRLPHGHHFAGKQGFAIVEELATGDTLLSVVLTQTLHRRRTVYSSQQALQWVMDIARGLEHLHTRQKRVIHRDLKLENVLLVHDGGRTVAKLADFGLCAYVTECGVPMSAVRTVATPGCRGDALMRWAQDAAALETPTHDSTHSSTKAASARCETRGPLTGGAEEQAHGERAAAPPPPPAAKPVPQLYPRVSRLEPLAGLSVLNSVREEAAPGLPTTLSFGAVRVPLGAPARICARKVPISPDVVPIRVAAASGRDDDDEGTHRGAVRCGSSSSYQLALRHALDTFYPDGHHVGPLSSAGTDCGTERIASVLHGAPSASPTPSGRHVSDILMLDSRDFSTSTRLHPPDSRDVSNGGATRLSDDAALDSHMLSDDCPVSGGLPQRAVQSHNVLDGLIDASQHSPCAGVPIAEAVDADTSGSIHVEQLVAGSPRNSGAGRPCSGSGAQPRDVGSSAQLSPAGMSPASTDSDVFVLPVCPGRALPTLEGTLEASPHADVACTDEAGHDTAPASSDRQPVDTGSTAVAADPPAEAGDQPTDVPASQPRRSLLDVATALRLNEPLRPRAPRRSHEVACTPASSRQPSCPATPPSQPQRPRKPHSRQLERGASDGSASTPLSTRLSRVLPHVPSLGRSLKSALSGRHSRSAATFAMTGRTGSLIYMAPEVKRCEEYNEKVDIFAAGVLMWELFARQSILAKFAEPTAIEKYSRDAAERGYRLPFPAYFPPELCDLISQCWHQDSRVRPSAVELLERLEQFDKLGVVDDIFPATTCCGFQ